MSRKALPTLLAAAIAATMFAGPADAKTKRHKRVKHAPAAESWQRGVHQQPARMIEVRPGLWISSFGCIQDEGYGRYSSCDLADGLH